MRQIMQSSLDYAGFAQLCGRSPIMREIMRAHNRIIPRSLTESTNYGCRMLINLDFCCPSMCSMCPPCAETQAARRLCHCFMALSISCWSILSHLLLWFLQKRHNYVSAHRIFNRLCQNQITISQLTYSLTDIRWKFHKLCPKTVRNIWKKQMYHFFLNTV